MITKYASQFFKAGYGPDTPKTIPPLSEHNFFTQLQFSYMILQDEISCESGQEVPLTDVFYVNWLLVKISDQRDW